MANFGISFFPGATDAGRRPEATMTPGQQIIRLLSLRLPSVIGAQGLAPAPLLQGPGAAGLSPMQLQWLVQRLLQQFQGQQFPGQAPSPATPGMMFPTPRIVPGVTPPMPAQVPAPGRSLEPSMPRLLPQLPLPGPGPLPAFPGFQRSLEPSMPRIVPRLPVPAPWTGQLPAYPGLQR